MPDRFIALDWGTTSFRAYRADARGKVLETITATEGILSVADGDFDGALERHIGGWDTRLPVMASGMITSRQGWIELPYAECPAGLAELAGSIHHHISRRGRRISFVTGLSCRDAGGVPDVLRGEETQVLGSLTDGAGQFIAPGTHAKWISVENGRITRFATYMTGEIYSALKSHTILGRLMAESPHDDSAFAKGCAAGLADPAAFLHTIFSTRTLALFRELAPESLSSYLSGIVIGTEIDHAASHGATGCVVLAAPSIGARYMRALEIAGLKAELGDPLSAVKGLAKIAASAGLLE